MASKIKILVNAFPMANVNTGISRYLRCLYTALEEQYGDRLEIGYFDGNRVSGEMPSGPQDLSRWAKVVSLFWKLPAYPALLARFLFHANQEMRFRKVVGDFDLYHEAAFFPFATPQHIPIVFTLTDLSLIRFPEYHPKERVLYSRFFFRRRCKTVKSFLTISSFIRDEMSVYIGIPKSNTTVTYPGYDPTVLYPRTGDEIEDCLNRLELPRKYFLFVGTGDPRKNMAVIPKALEQSGLGDLLVVAGWKGWVEQGLWDSAHFLGYVDDTDLARLYSGAIALIFPSRYEGFGLPVLEAMACGCPVVTTREASMPEVAGDAATYMKDPDDANGLANILTELAEQPETRRKYATKGLAQASRFSWRNTAESTFSVFERALESSKRKIRPSKVPKDAPEHNRPLKVAVGSQFMNVKMGGAERYIHEVCSRLERDHQMLLSYITSDGFGTFPLSATALKFKSSGFHHAWHREIRNILQRTEPDVVYVHHTVPWISDLLLHAAKDLALPAVLMYHSDVTGPEFTKKILGFLYNQFIARQSFKLCEKLLVPSQAFAEWSPYLARIKKDLTVVPPGVDPVMTEGHRNPERLYLLFIGKPHLKSKGIDLLVKAHKNLRSQWPDLELFVIGYIGKRYRRSKEEGVRYLGYVSSRRELADWYASAAVTVLSSTIPAESFGMVIAEALLAGCPVVGPNEGGVPGLIEDGLNGCLFSPGDVNDFSKAIERALKRQNELRSYILAKRKSYQEFYNWDRTAGIVADVLESAARRIV
ncbi:glycosyltransferase, group 1 family protein [delta proteobacterium NaphS2]|nr:glycosyltransferase, group 1 family protein [delta proteobacterium NaphS2]